MHGFVVVPVTATDQGIWQDCQKWEILERWRSIISPPQNLQEMTSDVGLTLSVGDSIPRFPISIEQDN